MTATQFSAPVSARAETGPHAGVMHVRHRHDSEFTVVGNHLAQHRELSAVAIGIGVHIQSLPDGARVSIGKLVERFPEGEVRIARALRELEAAGYLQRRLGRIASGQVVTRTTWYEQPGAQPVAADAPAEPEPASEPASEPVQTSQPEPEPADSLAAELLAGLRRQDPRVLLSERDVRRLAPAVRTWLDRGVSPVQVARTLPASAARRLTIRVRSTERHCPIRLR